MERRLILLGRIVGIFGVRGEVKLESHTEPRDNIFRYRPWLLRHNGVDREVESVGGRVQGKGLVARIPGCDQPEAAQALIGSEIWVDQAQLGPAGEGQFYWSELEGLNVVNVDGTAFGTVSHLFSTGSNDVLFVKGKRDRLIPYLRGDVIKSIDLHAGVIQVDWDPEF